MSASTHVIFRISKRLSEKLRSFGDGSISESLQAKQMLILAVNDLDRRYLELVKYVVAAMEEAQGKSARSRQNDLLEPFERACDIIKSKVDAALIPSDLDENKRSRLIYEIAQGLCMQYQSKAALSGCADFIKETATTDLNLKEMITTDLPLKMLQRTIKESKLRG